MAVKLAGFESEARALTDDDASKSLEAYHDADDVSRWAKKDVAVAVEHKLVRGFPDGSLESQDNMTGDQCATLVLRAAGYNDSQISSIFASRTNSENFPDISPKLLESDNTPISRSTAIDVSYVALNLKDINSDRTLIQNLVSNGSVSKTVAEKNGFYIDTPVIPAPIFVPYYPPADSAISFSSVELSALSEEATQLKLTFSADPSTLSIGDITVTGATKGTLNGTGNTRTLTVSDITVSNLESIKVAINNPSGYSISPSECALSTSNLLSFTAGAPATCGTQLTVSAGSCDSSLNYNWYQSDDKTLVIGAGSTDSMVGTGVNYEPVEAYAGKYLIVRADSTLGGFLVVATLATDKKIGSKIPSSIHIVSHTATSISLTDFAANASGFEVAVAINGTSYGNYQALSADASGSAEITGLSGVSDSTKCKIRIKETETSYAGPAQEFAVQE